MSAGTQLMAMHGRIEYNFNTRPLLLKEDIESPLEVAVREGNFKEVMSLIGEPKGDLRDSNIGEAMRLAGRYGQLEIAKALIEIYPYASDRSVLASLLSQAAMSNQLEMIKIALAHGIDINGGEEDWRTPPLVAAAIRGHTQIVTYLIEHGADVNLAESLLKRTPLVAALGNDHGDTARAILTTLRPNEIKSIKAAVASIRFAEPALVRDVRNMLTLRLIRLFTQEHMDYAKKIVDAAYASFNKKYGHPAAAHELQKKNRK